MEGEYGFEENESFDEIHTPITQSAIKLVTQSERAIGPLHMRRSRHGGTAGACLLGREERECASNVRPIGV